MRAEYTPQQIARFWSKADQASSPHGCWLWTGCSRNRDGYGGVNINGSHECAHRVAYIIARGPIPEGMEVCHNCPGGDNPRCVNPAHLFLGTHLDNMADRERKGRRRAIGAKNGSTKLTEDQAREIRRRGLSGENCAALGREFGISRSVAWAITRGRDWQHLGTP